VSPAPKSPVARRLVERLAFPVVFCAAILLNDAELRAGGDPTASSGVAIFGTMLIVGLLERLYPQFDSWLRSHRDVPTDIAHALTIGSLSGAITPLLMLAGIWAADWLNGRLGLGLWPTSWPWLAQLPVALIVAELPKYWHHRLTHEVPLLWRYHALHHSAPRLYFLNAARFHPIDIAIDTACGLLFILVLGCPIEVISLLGTASAVHGYFQHANLRTKIGWLNYVFSMAELHRWHHSQDLSEANHNYGQNLIFWDLVFGSYYRPADREPPEAIGLPGLSAFPMNYWQQMASPFTFRRIERASSEGKTGAANRAV
jgi:sterol desaturase/sphingolipid hydroxylase (fatty acid hydroxylase superfamily)